MNQITELYLRRAGWKAGRRVNIADIARPFQYLGLDSKAAIAFLEEFAGLDIVNNEASWIFGLGTAATMSVIPRTSMICMCNSIGQNGFPIGGNQMEQFICLESGRTYAVAHDYAYMHLLGESPLSALDPLCAQPHALNIEYLEIPGFGALHPEYAELNSKRGSK